MNYNRFLPRASFVPFHLLWLVLAALGSTATAASIEPGQTLTEQPFEWKLEYPERWEGTYGQYEMMLEAGIEYMIYTSEPHGGTTQDTYLYLLDAGFNGLAADDDSAGDLQARIVFTPSQTGTYYIRLRAFDRGLGGLCALTVSGPGALPDLIIWGPSANPTISEATFSSTSCAVVEGMVEPGTRKLLRFNSETRNQGTADLYLGNPALDPRFTWAPCHGHYHFGNYANYRLLDNSGQEAARGLKMGFCLLDTVRWDPNASPRARYTCNIQGIQKGWADIYDSTLDGQWIDITGLPDGNYTLEINVNPQRALAESNYDNNITRLPITIGNARPANDDFANAQGLTGSSASVSSSNTNATKEIGEPDHAGHAGGHSLWYFWTAPSSTEIVMDTIGSNFDTLLAVYTGDSLGGLTPVASNDDMPSSRQSLVAFIPVPGTTYRIAVDGWGGENGNIVLTLNQTPFNDDFAGCEFLGGTSGSATGSNGSATKEPGEPNHAGDAGGRSIWYCWTAPNTGPVTFDTIGSTFDTLLAVYLGNSVDSLTPVASNDDISNPVNLQSRVTFNAVATTHYHVAIDGWQAASGNTTLNWNMGGGVLFLASAPAPSAAEKTASLGSPPTVSYEFLNNLEYELAIVGQPLRRYTVEVSCDLTRWLPLATTLADSRGIAYFRDKAVMSGASEAWCAPPAARSLPTRKGEAKTEESRFYRVVEAQVPEALSSPRLKVRSPMGSK